MLVDELEKEKRKIFEENKRLTEDNAWAAKRILEADKKNKQLTEENEWLRAENETLKIATNDLNSVICDCHDKLAEMLSQKETDTVRKMQERFIAEIEQTPNANEHFIKAWKSKIDQIAKDILEGVEL